jgi:tetratricopeptide (TPR) repeat protein
MHQAGRHRNGFSVGRNGGIRSPEISQAIGDQAIILNNTGDLFRKFGAAERAIEIHKQALAIQREVCDIRRQGLLFGNLGFDYIALGNVEKAIWFYQQALTISRQIGDGCGQALWAADLAQANALLAISGWLLNI